VKLNSYICIVKKKKDMKTLQDKLQSVREESIIFIKDFFVTNYLMKVSFMELGLGNCPMVTPEKSLDCIIYDVRTNKFAFEASGEYDNECYCLEKVSTDCLVEVVEMIEEYHDDIIEYYNEEE